MASGSDPEVQRILDRARDEAIDKMLVNQGAAAGESEECGWPEGLPRRLACRRGGQSFR